MLAVVMACGAAFSPAVQRLRRRVAGSGVRGFGVLGIGVWGFRVRGSLWLLFVLPALAAGFGALDDAGRTAIVPNQVRRTELNSHASAFLFGRRTFDIFRGYWPDQTDPANVTPAHLVHQRRSPPSTQ